MFAMCMQCQAELGHPSFEPFWAEYFDQGVAYLECSRGHKTAFLVQSQKFEVLLESGANALLEGFTFEACAAFSAALERFYEFSLHVMCIARDMPEELFQKMFTEMTRQSERQLGAFMMLHAIELGEAYKPDKHVVEFRNGVIHKGIIPNLEEATKFCSAVYEIIAKLFERLSGKYSEQIRKLVRHELHQKRKSVSTDVAVGTSTGTMFFNISQTGKPKAFDEALDSFRTARAVVGGAVPILRNIYEKIRGLKN